MPGASPVHRLWAGTKLLAVAALAVVLALRPEWPAVAVVTALVVVGIVVARIPRGALPHLPRWFWIGFGLGAFLTLRSSTKPKGHILGVSLSWGGLELWALAISLSVLVLFAAALLSWTTPLAEVAPAIARLGRPLKWLRLPVDEWAAAIALSIRCLPLLMDEVRTMAAARRLRPSTREQQEPRMNWWIREADDLLFTSISVSLRRAAELGDAMEARGGFGSVSDSKTGPGWNDVVALSLVAAVIVAAALV